MLSVLSFFFFFQTFFDERFKREARAAGLYEASEISVFTSQLCVWNCLSYFLSSPTGPPRMSPKSQRTPRAHRVPPCRTAGVPPGGDMISHNAPGEVPVTQPTRSSSSGGTWSSVVSGGKLVNSFPSIYLHYTCYCVLYSWLRNTK